MCEIFILKYANKRKRVIVNDTASNLTFYGSLKNTQKRVISILPFIHSGVILCINK